jgi:hypothetical protein
VLKKVEFPDARREAGISAREAFLAPLIVTSPDILFPPFITNLSNTNPPS